MGKTSSKNEKTTPTDKGSVSEDPSLDVEPTLIRIPVSGIKLPKENPVDLRVLSLTILDEGDCPKHGLRSVWDIDTGGVSGTSQGNCPRGKEDIEEDSGGFKEVYRREIESNKHQSECVEAGLGIQPQPVAGIGAVRGLHYPVGGATGRPESWCHESTVIKPGQAAEAWSVTDGSVGMVTMVTAGQMVYRGEETDAETSANNNQHPPITAINNHQWSSVDDGRGATLTNRETWRADSEITGQTAENILLAGDVGSIKVSKHSLTEPDDLHSQEFSTKGRKDGTITRGQDTNTNLTEKVRESLPNTEDPLKLVTEEVSLLASDNNKMDQDYQEKKTKVANVTGDSPDCDSPDCGSPDCDMAGMRSTDGCGDAPTDREHGTTGGPGTTRESLDLAREPSTTGGPVTTREGLDLAREPSTTGGPVTTREGLDLENEPSTTGGPVTTRESLDLAREPSTTGGPGTTREGLDLAREPSTTGGPGTTRESLDLAREPSTTGGPGTTREGLDLENEPSTTGGPVTTRESLDLAREPSTTGGPGTTREGLDLAREPSTTGGPGTTRESLDLAREPSTTGGPGTTREGLDLAREPSTTGGPGTTRESLDLAREPSTTGGPGTTRESLDLAREPSTTGGPGTTREGLDLAREPSTTGGPGTTREGLDLAREPSTTGGPGTTRESLDLAREPSTTGGPGTTREDDAVVVVAAGDVGHAEGAVVDEGTSCRTSTSSFTGSAEEDSEGGLKSPKEHILMNHFKEFLYMFKLGTKKSSFDFKEEGIIAAEGDVIGPESSVINSTGSVMGPESSVSEDHMAMSDNRDHEVNPESAMQGEVLDPTFIEGHSSESLWQPSGEQAMSHPASNDNIASNDSQHVLKHGGNPENMSENYTNEKETFNDVVHYNNDVLGQECDMSKDNLGGREVEKVLPNCIVKRPADAVSDIVRAGPCPLYQQSVEAVEPDPRGKEGNDYTTNVARHTSVDLKDAQLTEEGDHEVDFHNGFEDSGEEQQVGVEDPHSEDGLSGHGILDHDLPPSVRVLGRTKELSKERRLDNALSEDRLSGPDWNDAAKPEGIIVSGEGHDWSDGDRFSEDSLTEDIPDSQSRDIRSQPCDKDMGDTVQPLEEQHHGLAPTEEVPSEELGQREDSKAQCFIEDSMASQAPVAEILTKEALVKLKNNDSVGDSPKKLTAKAIGEGHSPERLTVEGIGEGHSPERLTEEAIGEGHIPERLTEEAIGEGHSPERVTEEAMGERHSPEQLTAAAIGEGHSPERLTVEDIDEGHSLERLTEEAIGEGHSLERLTAEAIGEGHSPEQLTAAAIREGHSPEQLTAEAIGEEHSPERLTAEAIGEGHSPEQLTVAAIGEGHSPERLTAEAIGEGHSPERFTEEAIGEGHSPERLTVAAIGEGHSPERLTAEAIGEGHSPERFTEEAIGEGHSPEQLTAAAIGEGHSPERLTAAAIGEGHSPERVTVTAIGEGHSPERLTAEAIGEGHSPERVTAEAIGEGHSPERFTEEAIGEGHSPEQLTAAAIGEGHSPERLTAAAIGEGHSPERVTVTAIGEGHSPERLTAEAIGEGHSPERVTVAAIGEGHSPERVTVAAIGEGHSPERVTVAAIGEGHSPRLTTDDVSERDDLEKVIEDDGVGESLESWAGKAFTDRDSPERLTVGVLSKGHSHPSGTSDSEKLTQVCERPLQDTSTVLAGEISENKEERKQGRQADHKPDKWSVLGVVVMGTLRHYHSVDRDEKILYMKGRRQFTLTSNGMIEEISSEHSIRGDGKEGFVPGGNGATTLDEIQTNNEGECTGLVGEAEDNGMALANNDLAGPEDCRMGDSDQPVSRESSIESQENESFSHDIRRETDDVVYDCPSKEDFELDELGIIHEEGFPYYMSGTVYDVKQDERGVMLSDSDEDGSDTQEYVTRESTVVTEGSKKLTTTRTTKVRFYTAQDVSFGWKAAKRLSEECVPDAEGLEGHLKDSASKMSKMLQEAEQAQRDESPDLDGAQAKVTLQAYGLKIGDKVMVGGVKTGILRYCGPTEFASGIWAGIELDEPAGKNDGSVGGVSYFKCSPKHGIFAPVTKISKPGILLNRSQSTPRRAVHHGHVDTSKVTAKVDTGLHRTRSGRTVVPPTDDENILDVGERVLVAGQRRGLIRYSGETNFAPGWWYGIELDRPVGKNDGSVNGKRYFMCKPKYGVFAPPSRIQKLSDLPDAGECLDALAERQRRMSADSVPSSYPALHVSPSKNKASLSRPKSSGGTGMARRSLSLPNPGGEFRLQEGTSVFCNNELGIIRYIGNVDFAEGIWLGVELRTNKGKNDGSVQGRRYFICKPEHGLIVRPSKVTVRGINGAKLMGNLELQNDGDKKEDY